MRLLPCLETAAQGNSNVQQAVRLDYQPLFGKNKFLLADGGNDYIKVFNQSGTFLLKFGKKGNQDGQLKWPRGMLLDSSNNLLVCDYHNNRVQQFSLDGRFTGKTITDLPAPAGIATAPDGRILVTSYAANKVYILK